MTIIRVQYALDSASFLPITAPCDAESFIFSNDENAANDIYTRTVSSDAATQRRFPAGSFQSYKKEDGTRIMKNEVLFYAKTVSGTQNVNGEFKS